MKKELPASLILPQFLIFRFSQLKFYSKISCSKTKLSLLFFFACFSMWAQHPPFTADGTILVPAGVLTMNVEGWGGGGAGGGASASTALTGRSGAGGGGGAYAKGVISVTAGATLNVKVAQTTVATTGSGGNGGNSYIQGYDTVFLAAGGSGGPVNSTGGSPAGGAGGSATISKGSITTTAGGDGGAGATALLNLLAGSGAGGKGGGTGGGAGGPSAGSVLLAVGPGQPGTAPGGGGSGGLHLSGSPAQLGGNGAAGQVNVTYTCPTYSVNNLQTLINACTSVGTAKLRLTGTTLPIGVYVVTYNRTNPTGTGLTAAMTVTGAGSGDFDVVGLTTSGTSTITVTGLASGVCTNSVTVGASNVTVSPPSVGGSVGTSKSVCSGSTSGLLTLTGHTGSVLRWESSTDSFVSDITPITNTIATYTSGALTQTTQFRAVIQSGTCTAVNSTPVTITVNPLPQGSLTANGPFCATGSGLLTFTATSGVGPFTVIYTENGGTNRTASGVVSGTPFATFTTPVTSTTTYAIVSVTDANTCIRSTGFTGGSATITVNPLPQGSLMANGPFCATGTGQLTFTASAGTGPFTVIYTENGGTNRTASGVVSGTPFATFTTPVTSTTTYTLVSVTDANSCIRSSGFTGGSAAITVNSLPQGNLTANGPFCATGTGQLTFTATSGVGPFTIIYKENGGANQTATNVISGTAFNAATNPVAATTAYTLVSVTDANSCIRSTGFTGGSAAITVNPLPQGSLTANGPFCATGTGQLTFTASAGTGPFTVIYKENGGANQTATNVTSGTAFNAATNPVTATTAYTLVSVTDANSCIRNTGFTGGSATITVNSLPQGSLTANGPFCATGSGQLTFTATSGVGPFTVIYTENGGTNRTASGVISGTAFATFTTPVTTSTTYAIVSVTDANSCIRSTGFTSGSATITVNPLPQGSLSANGPFCATGTGQLTFTASAGTGPFTVIYKENGGANQTATNVTSGTAFNAATNPVTATTAYTLVSVTDANSCIRSTGFTGGSATITVNSLPQGSLTANGPFCATGSGQLTFTATSGVGPFTVIYTENGGTNRTASGVVSGTPFATFTTPVISTTTYAIVSVTDANSCIRSTGFTGGSATITVNPLPQGSLTANGPFCATGTGQLTFTATSGVGPFTVIYKENGGANQTATNVASGTPFNAATNPVTATTAYTLVSVTDSHSCIRSSAFTGGSATITVNPLPQGSLSANGPFCATGTGQLTFTATSGVGPFTVIYTENGGTNRTASGVVSGTPFATFTTPVISTTTYAIVSVTDANSCIRSTGFTGGSAAITVNPLPQGSLTANGPFCATGSGQLTFTAASGVGPFTVIYTENGGTNRTATGVVSGTPFNTFTTPVTTTTTYALVSVTDANSCIRSTGFTGGSASIVVNPKPTAPVPGTVVQPTCVTPTGSITLNGLIPSVTWTITQSNGTVQQTYTGTGTSFTVTNLAAGVYTFTVEQISTCPSAPTAGIEIFAPVTNTWNGTAWSKGSEPVITDAIRFSGNYSTTGNLSGCSCLVDPGVNVTVNSNHTLTITNAVTNNGGALTFENNSSLLQTTNAVNSGNITYKRNTSTRRYDYTYWSSPVVRTPVYTLHDLSPNTLADKYTSYNPNSGWVISYNGILPMTPGQGYSVRGPQNFDIVTPGTQIATFVGVPNNGNVTVNFVGPDLWHLIGNPYPSALYADQFISDNTDNIYGTLYFWTHNTPPANGGTGTFKYNTADYAIYNMTGGTQGATTPGNQTPPSGYIAAGQAFFACSRANPSAIFTNSMRVPGNNSQFFKTTASNKANLERHRVWLNLTNTEGAFKQILVGYIEGATNLWDHNYDGISLNGNPYVDFYSINNGQNLAIQGRALPFEESDVVPLGYRSAIAGQFTIAIDHTDGLLSSHAVYLEDKVTQTIHNLQTSNYNFTTAIGTFTERFVLRYTNGTLGVDDFTNQNNSFYATVKDKNINLNSGADSMKEVSIFDISGKLLYNNKKVQSNELHISQFQSGDQVLILKVSLENGNIITKKIIFN